MKIKYAGSNGDSLKNETKPSTPNRLRDIVECPVCLKTPRCGAPIFQCRNGHIICRECYKRVETNCPVCRVLLYTNTKIRCISAEKIIERLYEAGMDLAENHQLPRREQRALESVSHQVVLANTKEGSKRENLLEVANDLMDLWMQDTRDAESRILVITHNSEDAQSVQDWINNEFDFAPLMATSIYADLNQFQMDLALKMFFYSPPLPRETVDQTKEEEENPYPGIPTGCCRFLVATMDTINKFKDTDTLWGKVNHVINYELPNNIEEYRHRVGLMNNSETNADMGVITTIFSPSSLDERGKFACDLTDLIKSSGQEVPFWLSDCAMKHSSLVKNEMSFFYNIVIFSLKNAWKLVQTCYNVIPYACINFVKLLRFIFFVSIFAILQFVLDKDNIKRSVKSALWIVVYCFLMFFLTSVTYLIAFGYQDFRISTMAMSESLYSNLQHIGSDVYENVKQWLIG